MSITAEEARIELARRELARRQSAQEQPSQPTGDQAIEQPQQQMSTIQGMPNTGMSPEQGGLALGAAALIGGGAIGGRAYIDPWIKKNALLKQLVGMQQQLGIEGTEKTFVPTKLNQLLSSEKMKYQENIKKLRLDTDLAVKSTKQAISDFDNNILNKNVEDISKNIKELHSTFIKSGHEGYSKGMKAIEGALAKENVVINPVDFANNVFGRAEAEANQYMWSPEEIKQISDVKNRALGMMYEKDMPTTLKFSQAKSLKDILTSDYKSRVSTLINRAWGDYLENSPAFKDVEVKQMLGKLNNDYRSFAQTKIMLDRISDPRTGEFNYKGLNKYFLDYAKQNIDNGTTNLMKMLSEGNDMVSSMEGMNKKFAGLSDVKTQRAVLNESIPAMKKAQAELARSLEEKSTAEVNKIIAWKNKAEEILSKARAEQQRIDNRTLLSIPKRILGGLGRGIPMLGIATQILDAGKYVKDPEAYIASLASGGSINLAEKGTEERKLQEFKMRGGI